MFRTIERRDCRHQTMARHLGEEMAPCGTSCDACAGLDPVGAAPAVATKRMSFGTRAATAEAPSSGGSPMFTKLRALRKKLADARHVPAYMVFNDATLMSMAERRPSTEDEMRQVPGVGPKKWVEYGEIFIAALRDG
jgi:ATP-dependent DNA helicase RecQ